MIDKPTYQDRLKGILHPNGNGGSDSKSDLEDAVAEIAGAAFGYLRGIRDTPGAVEFRFRKGVSVWFPYSWLGPWWFDPSEGLLLKFSGDMVYLVLIRGSNLDKPLGEGSINLTSGGLQRNRIVWIREMSEADIRLVGESGPTVDSIDIEQFESHEALNAWLEKHAPAFAHKEH
jgi:hypothetical protein